MKIKEIIVENFRLLKEFQLELEDDLSLLIGKNNVGKTSLLVVLDKFLNYGETKKFQYNDFNLDFRTELKELIENEKLERKDYKELGIRLRLLIEYNDKDDLEYISPILMDLDVANNFLGLGFDYTLSYDMYLNLREAYQTFKNHEEEKEAKSREKEGQYVAKTLDDFLDSKQSLYFFLIRKSIHINKDTESFEEENYINLKDVTNFNLKDVVNFQYINAKRNVDNKEVDKTLSTQTSELYKVQETDDKQQEAIEQFQDRLKDTDVVLSSVYDKMFADIIDKVRKFGGMARNETIIKVVSSLQHRELLKGNTTVVYQQADKELPENYNGLGYMNLISMIFDIDLIIKKMQRNKERKPADINLLFIEEPEAHTHPQMQYVFIKNIKNLLEKGISHKDGISRKLQYIVSSHSAHIVADCDFDDIKYIVHSQKNGIFDKNSVIAKNMKDLQKEYECDAEHKQYFAFLKQYLTLNRSELFFADKAIFIEGDTERILLPAMMKKVDEEVGLTENENYLLSQNISIIEVGAYSHIFEKFIRFIGLRKGLIITDLDCCEPVVKTDKNGRKTTKYQKAQYDATNDTMVTSNASIKYFLNTSSIKDILSDVPVKLSWDDAAKCWKREDHGNIMLAFQYGKEGAYQPRSFEDAFFSENKEFITSNTFSSLDPECVEKFQEDNNPYELAQKGVNGKSSLAIEILLNGNTETNPELGRWNIPTYIKEGLLWLRKD